MNTTSENWQEKHERNKRLKSIFDEDRQPEPELVRCSYCDHWRDADELDEKGECSDCRSYIEDHEN